VASAGLVPRDLCPAVGMDRRGMPRCSAALTVASAACRLRGAGRTLDSPARGACPRWQPEAAWLADRSGSQLAGLITGVARAERGDEMAEHPFLVIFSRRHMVNNLPAIAQIKWRGSRILVQD